MRAWHKRALIDTAKALVPGRQRLRHALRRLQPYETDPELDEGLLGNSMRTIAMLREAGIDLRGKRVLEIGSGWHPILPVTYLAAGAQSVTLTDIESLLDARLLRSALDYVLARREAIAARTGAADFDRLRVADAGLPTMLRELALDYRVPYSSADSAAGSADVIVSVSVLEHIPPGTLHAMCADFRRILAPGGAMVHLIDCSDHRAMWDPTVSRCDFLRYEEWAWRLCCLNPQTYHNRLRHSDLVALFQQHGFRIAYAWRESRAKEQADLQGIPLASPFRGRDPEDLAAISSHVVAVTPG